MSNDNSEGYYLLNKPIELLEFYIETVKPSEEQLKYAAQHLAYPPDKVGHVRVSPSDEEELLPGDSGDKQNAITLISSLMSVEGKVNV